MLRVTIRLMGPVKVTGPQHEDLTPTGAKTTALLSLLAVANGGYCSRAWLQEKLWSDRSPQQGQDSLRHAISNLKKALGKYSYIILIKGRMIAMDRDTTLIDLYDDVPEETFINEPEQFLSGIEVKDSEFDGWLKSMRLNLVNNSALAMRRESADVEQSGIHVGLLPVESLGPGEDAYMIGTSLLHRLGTSLRNLGPFSIYDYSDQSSSSPDKFIGPDVLMALRCVQMGDCFSVSLSLHRVVDKKVIWSAIQTLPSKHHSTEVLSTLVIQVTDQIATVLSHPGVLGEKERHHAARLVLGALDKMFASSGENLDEADEALSLATELEQKGVYFAWRAYLQVFRLDTFRRQGVQRDIKQLANEIADRALELDSNNPLTLALLTHVYAFIFRDFNRAQTLIEPALAMKSDSLMAQDSYALLNFYMGNLSNARTAASKVLDASMFNPYRYCFATSLCMIETVSQNYDAAAEYGEKALAMHSPNQEIKFLPTLRYLATAQAGAGNTERAAELYSMLKKQDPEFRSEDVEADDFPVPSKMAASILKQGLHQIEDESDQ